MKLWNKHRPKHKAFCANIIELGGHWLKLDKSFKIIHEFFFSLIKIGIFKKLISSCFVLFVIASIWPMTMSALLFHVIVGQVKCSSLMFNNYEVNNFRKLWYKKSGYLVISSLSCAAEHATLDTWTPLHHTW